MKIFLLLVLNNDGLEKKILDFLRTNKLPTYVLEQHKLTDFFRGLKEFRITENVTVLLLKPKFDVSQVVFLSGILAGAKIPSYIIADSDVFFHTFPAFISDFFIKIHQNSIDEDLHFAIKKHFKNQVNELEIDLRFNFFLTQKLINYLDWISKSKKVSRSVYLRRLIELQMDTL